MAVDVEQYYRTYGPMVLRRCRSILKDEEQAVDAMHDVFVQVLKRRDVLEHRAPSSLLYTIATNTCLNKLRARKRRPEIAGDDVVEQIASLESTEEAVLSRHFLDRLFAREPETTRTIAVLHYVDRLTLEETAEHVGLSVSGVRKRLRGLRKKGLALREI